MKSLKQYLHNINKGKQFNFVYPLEQSFDDFLSCNNLNEDNVTNDACNWYAENCWDKIKYLGNIFYNDDYAKSPLVYINEMLQSTNISLLVKKLNKELDGPSNKPICITYNSDDVKQGERTVNTIIVPIDRYNKKQIQNICDKMMWTFTSVKCDNGWNKNPNEKDAKPEKYTDKKYPYYKIRVEPIQSTICTDFVNKKCNNILYHICRKEDKERILKSGLRMKGEKNSYRYIKNKVYLICGEDNENIFNNIRRVASSMWYWDWDKNELKDKACLLKIDCNNYNIDFYEDTMYEFDYGDDNGYKNEKIVYTYAYFPPKMIKEITIDEIID